MAGFEHLGLSADVLRGVEEMGFEEPTPVQERAIPLLLAGRDVIAQALTGTGKTAAFGIPLVERIDVERTVPQAVVLAPTRELAVQVAEQLSGIGRQRGLLLVPIYGGQPMERQLRALRHGVHAIVATPGRLMDHIRRGTVDLSSVSMLVLDEADTMLDMGFLEDVEFIMKRLPPERVTALFSATIPEPILALTQRYMRQPEVIRLSQQRALTVPETDQIYYVVPFPHKFDALGRVLDAKRPDRALVFAATKRMVDEIVERLQGRGYRAEGLHGDMSQVLREKVLRAFRDGRAEVMVATDVAARGLDITDVTHVVNFDIPPDPEYYVHRIGRTGRLGKSGVAITFVNPREMRELKVIQQITGARIRREEVPTGEDVEARDAQILEERLTQALSGGKWGRYRDLVEGFLDDHDPIDVASAALSLVAARTSRAPRSHYEPSAGEPRVSRPPERPRAARTHDRPRRQPGRPFRREEPPGEPSGVKRKPFGPPPGRPRR